MPTQNTSGKHVVVYYFPVGSTHTWKIHKTLFEHINYESLWVHRLISLPVEQLFMDLTYTFFKVEKSKKKTNTKKNTELIIYVLGY